MASSRRKKRRKLKKRISAGLIVVSLALAGFLALLLTPIFSVRNITVQGNQTVSAESIVRGSGIVEGTNIFNVSLGRVRDNIEGMERISSVRVSRVLPSTIRITVVEGAPIVYIYDDGDCVGITADGRVTDVVRAAAVPAPMLEAEVSDTDDETNTEDETNGEEETGGEAVDETDETSSDEEATDEETDETTDETTDEEPTDEESSAGRVETAGEIVYESTALDCAVVTGMGDISYKVGGTIEFADEVKGENLFKLMEEFLGDEICRSVTSIDMSRYDSVSFVYGGTLNVNVGAVENLSYKLNCFKAIMEEQLGEGTSGTLDLERLTYSPKNN